MLGRNRQPASPIGVENFNTCAVRRVSFEQSKVRDLSGPVYGAFPLTIDNYRATLDCPRLGENDQRPTTEHSYDTQDQALESLGRHVGKLICETCVFAGKTRIEVMGIQQQEAEAERDLLRAQRERIEAQEALRQAQTEVDEINKKNGVEF